MKKIAKLVSLFLIILFACTNICYGLNVTFSSNKTQVKPDEEIILTITFDKKVVVANFNINYDSSVFKFVEGININAAEKNGKIACIYADSTLKGTYSFSIKFKAIKESSSATFSIDEAKIRESGQEESVTTSDIAGLSRINVEVKKEEPIPDPDPQPNPDPTPDPTPDPQPNPDPTPDPTPNPTSNLSNNQSDKPLPNAGSGSRYIILISILAIGTIAIISKKKFNNLKMIFTIIPFLAIGFLCVGNAEVKAVDITNYTINTYSKLIENKKVMAVILPQNSSDLSITATELTNLAKSKLGYTIESITKDDASTLNSTNKVNTGAKIKVGNDEYTALIYGDANGDGDICDADDLMVIINDFLGKKSATGVNRLAADLANKDGKNILDTDDLMQMINMYLGKLKGDLVEKLPENEDVIKILLERHKDFAGLPSPNGGNHVGTSKFIASDGYIYEYEYDEYNQKGEYPFNYMYQENPEGLSKVLIPLATKTNDKLSDEDLELVKQCIKNIEEGNESINELDAKKTDEPILGDAVTKNYMKYYNYTVSKIIEINPNIESGKYYVSPSINKLLNIIEKYLEPKLCLMQINDWSKVAIGSGYSWIYNVYGDGTVKGEKWTSGSEVGFVSSKVKEYTVKLENDDLQFLKDIKSKYIEEEEEDNAFEKIDIYDDNNNRILPFRLNSDNRETLKQILNKIFLKREPITLNKYVVTNTVGGLFPRYTYKFDLIEKEVVYEDKTYGGNLRYFTNTKKELKDEDVKKIEEICLNMLASPFGYDAIPTDQAYFMWGSLCIDNGTEAFNTINSIVADMDKLDGIKADIEDSVSDTCSIHIAGFSDTDLSNKGYDFIEDEEYYYMIISKGECKNGAYFVYVDNMYFIGDTLHISTEDGKLEDGTVTTYSQEKNYPYCLIKFNKKINNIYLDDENYKKINMRDLITKDKPVIYLYPEEETKISVKVGNPERFTCTYPKYEDGWKVIAKPNGNLIDIKTGRNLYCLYWEGINTVAPRTDEGFIVKGEDTAKFLEEKLEILGLNEREANEFIIYWLPQLEKNKYNFIRFQTEEEINSNMPLDITPKPDTIIRVMMEWKPLDRKIEVKEQKLEAKERTGYTAVEWGGTKIK